MREEKAIKRIAEQINKSNIKDYDPTATLLDKFQKVLAKLEKKKKFDTKTYYKLYPLDTIPLRVYGVMKAYTPEKIFNELRKEGKFDDKTYYKV